MQEFSTTILREKFTVKDLKGKSDSLVVGSNRMTLPLKGEGGIVKELFVIRGKFMYEVARYGAATLSEFSKRGPFMNRPDKFDWEDLYLKHQSDYIRKFVPDNWLCIYNNGKPVFTHGERHPFLDVVEKCDVKNEDEYDFAVAMAEDAFRTAGKDVSIDHLSTIALVTHAYQDKVRCGVIDRNINKTRTFNMTAGRSTKPNSKVPEPSSAIHTAAAFLEGMNMCYKVGAFNARLTKGDAKQGSDEHKEQKEALKIIGVMNNEVEAFNNAYDVRYRPEMPDFQQVIREVEGSAL